MGEYETPQSRGSQKLAGDFGLIPTGGSDYHGPNMHPTPLGARDVPEESVKRLRLSAQERRRAPAPTFELPPYRA